MGVSDFAGPARIGLSFSHAPNTVDPGALSGVRSGRECVSFLLLVVALTLSAGACGENAHDAARPDDLSHTGLATPVDSVTGELLAAPDTLGLATDLLAVGPYLLANDALGPPYFHLFSAATGERLLSAGEEGSGPGEFSSLKYMAQGPGPGRRVSLFDLSQGRLTFVGLPGGDELEQNLDFTDDLLGETISLYEASSHYPVWVDDSTLVATGMFADGRLGVMDRAGDLRTQVGPLPAPGRDEPPLVRQQAYQSTLVRHPRRDLLALGTRYGSQLLIVRPDGTVRDTARTPFDFRPAFHVADGDRMSLEQDTRLGYVDLAATDGRLYGLFSGRLLQGSEDASLAHHVHVFSWDGRLRRILRVDEGLIAIEAAGDSILYGSSMRPVPAIRRYTRPGGDP